MGGGSAPELKIPDVGLVFGLSLLIGYVLMVIKSGSSFSEHIFTNIFMILLGVGLTSYGIYFNYIVENENNEAEVLEAELIN